MFKPVLLALFLLSCTTTNQRPSVANGFTSTDTVVDTTPVDTLAQPTDTPVTLQVKSEKLCLLLKMPNGRIRILSQQAGVKQCEDVYKTLPDSLRTTSLSDRYAFKSGTFIAIQLSEWGKGWSPGKDTVSRRLDLY